MVNNEFNHQEMMLNGDYNVTEDNLEIVEDIEEETLWSVQLPIVYCQLPIANYQCTMGKCAAKFGPS